MQAQLSAGARLERRLGDTQLRLKLCNVHSRRQLDLQAAALLAIYHLVVPTSTHYLLLTRILTTYYLLLELQAAELREVRSRDTRQVRVSR